MDIDEKVKIAGMLYRKYEITYRTAKNIANGNQNGCQTLQEMEKEAAQCELNQSTRDFYNYSKFDQEQMLNFCRSLVPLKTRKTSTYSVKHWAENVFLAVGTGPSYVSTGAIKEALLKTGFDLDPHEFNALVNVSERDGRRWKKRLQEQLGWDQWL